MLAKTKFKPFAVLACVVLVLLALFCIGNVDADAATYSGNCGAEGDNVKWSLDTETGTLTISGTGEMEDYAEVSETPWYVYSSEIEAVVIEDGVTSVGNCSFRISRNLTKVVIGDDVIYIGGEAFVFSALPFASTT